MNAFNKFLDSRIQVVAILNPPGSIPFSMQAHRFRSTRLLRPSAFSAVLIVLAFILLLAQLVFGPLASFHHGVSPQLPMAFHSVPLWASQRDDALQVGILRDGQTFFDTQRVTAEELTEKLRTRVRGGAPPKVYISADRRVHYSYVSSVLDSIHSAGLTNVAFLSGNLH
jgi:biopolymer transport protein ExbD